MAILRAPTTADNAAPETAHAAAEWLAALGVCAIPVRKGSKQPSIKWEAFQSRLPTAEERRRWWDGNLERQLAIVCGPVSDGLACRDFDEADAYHRWAANHADLAATLPTVRTARGFHVYFRADESVAEVAVRKLADGELRVSRCYNLAPPSLHPSGIRYVWLRPMRPVGELVAINPVEFGLAGSIPRLDWTENTEPTEPTEPTDAMLVNGGVAPPPQEQGSGLDPGLLAIIHETLPRAARERENRLFELARRLKGLPTYRDAPAKELLPVVREWHRRALDVIATKPWEETKFAFHRSWGNVLFPAGECPLDELAAKCKHLPPPRCALEYNQPALRQLVTIARELARLNPQRVFFLSCRTAGRLVGQPHSTTAVWLKGLVYDEVLRIVEQGTAQTMKAHRYQYLRPLDE